jgi:hypothetical protein
MKKIQEERHRIAEEERLKREEEERHRQEERRRILEEEEKAREQVFNTYRDKMLLTVYQERLRRQAEEEERQKATVPAIKISNELPKESAETTPKNSASGVADESLIANIPDKGPGKIMMLRDHVGSI